MSNPFPIYLESKNKLYLPKFYGIEKFGNPEVNKVPPGDTIDVKLIAIDERSGKLKLSRKVLLPKPEKKKDK